MRSLTRPAIWSQDWEFQRLSCDRGEDDTYIFGGWSSDPQRTSAKELWFRSPEHPEGIGIHHTPAHINTPSELPGPAQAIPAWGSHPGIPRNTVCLPDPIWLPRRQRAQRPCLGLSEDPYPAPFLRSWSPGRRQLSL